MRNVLLILLAVALMSGRESSMLEQARQIARAEQKLILVRFTGSDWCRPCKLMDKKVFQSDSFNNFGAAHLVLIEADFPKDKELDEDTRRENKELARKYQKAQSYPYTVLLDADGKLLKTWRGYGGQYPSYYLEEIYPFLPKQNNPATVADSAATMHAADTVSTPVN